MGALQAVAWLNTAPEVTCDHSFIQYIVLFMYFRLFPNMGDKTDPFTVYATFMQKDRAETRIETHVHHRNSTM